MGTLSKEIEKIDELIVEAEQRNYIVGSIWPDRRKQLVHLKETYPHLDHPATPFVEEMVEYVKLMAEKNWDFEVVKQAKALLQKIKEAE